jgi:ribose transport system substrate-binding protein
MKRSVLIMIILIAALFAGCGRKESESSQRKIYFIAKASEAEFWQVVMDGGRVAGQDFGAEVVTQAPVAESDIDRQVSIFNNVLLTNPDAIVVAPLLADLLIGPLDKAADMGIPVIIIDSAANTDKYTSFLASDNTKIGTVAAKKMVELLEDDNGKVSGKVAGITFLSGGASLEKRKNGFLEEIAKHPEVEMLEFQDAQGRQGVTINIVKNLVMGNPNLKGIFANNQPTGEETVRALEMINRKDLAVVVVDSGAEEIRGLREGYVDYVIAQRPWAMGYMGVEYALKAIAGEQMDKFIDTGIMAIDKTMLESGAADEVLDPVAFNLKKRQQQ